MPIGATIGAAAIGAGGAILGGNAQKSAANKAAATATQTNDKNISFLTDIYHQNEGHFAPYEQSGQVANNAIMQLLGLSGPPQAQSAFPGYAPTPAYAPQAFGGGYSGGTGNVARYMSLDGPAVDPALAQQLGDTYSNMQYGQPQPYNPGTVTTAAPAARSAFDNYLNSDGYQFRFDQGVNALQKAFGRNLDSGAAEKAAIRFGQGTASDEFSRYMSLLNQQQQLGYGSASALAGVGQNFGNAVTAGNTAAGNAQANAQLYAGSANANMWKGIGSSFGQALGSFGGMGGGSSVTGTPTGSFNGIPLMSFAF